MPLFYSLSDNPVTQDPHDCSAVIRKRKTLTFEDLINRMISRGSTLTKAEVLANMEEFFQCVEDGIMEGYDVVTPLFMAKASIMGRFDGPDDQFDNSRHKVKLRIQPGTRLRKVEPDIRVKKVTHEQKLPEPGTYHDFHSNTGNNIISPGKPATITGSNLKIDESDPQQGVFFVNHETGEVLKVEQLQNNMPRKLMFINPLLTTGNYSIQVRNIFRFTKRLRIGILSQPLKVPA